MSILVLLAAVAPPMGQSLYIGPKTIGQDVLEECRWA